MDEVIPIPQLPQPTPTSEGLALIGIGDYFLSIGCNTTKRLGRFEDHILIKLPLGIDDWRVDIEGDSVSLMKLRDQRRANVTKFNLLDPDCFIHMFNHMEKHSKFLRGGTSNKIWKAKPW
jgi:hypothetical protein